MSGIALLCRSATPFKTDGSLDEEAMRKLLHRFIDSKIGVVLGSSGTGEGYALSDHELSRIFQIGREECAGKVPVYGNPPEQHTAKRTSEQAQLAVAAKVDAVTVFGLAGWHGMRPTDLELRNYYDTVLSSIKHPVSLAVNPQVGYTPKVGIVADMCAKHTHVQSVVLTGVPDTYFLELKSLVTRKIDYFAQMTGSLNLLTLGACGLFAAEANAMPKTYRRYVDFYDRSLIRESAGPYEEIKRLLHYVSTWSHANARWVKMFMKVMKLPGGEGGLREPYALPPQEELDKFTKGLLALGIAEVDEQARAAGIK